MIKGIGTDIIEIDRIAKSIEKPSFVDTIFSELEQKLYHGTNPQTLAGNFAVKEAVAKAFGTGFKGCSPLEIEVLRKKSGQPYVVLNGNARKIYEELGGKKLLVSISHSKENVVAFVVIEG